jgi:hypothetical protein
MRLIVTPIVRENKGIFTTHKEAGYRMRHSQPKSGLMAISDPHQALRMNIKLADWLEDYFKFHVCHNVEFSMEVSPCCRGC